MKKKIYIFLLFVLLLGSLKYWLYYSERNRPEGKEVLLSKQCLNKKNGCEIKLGEKVLILAISPQPILQRGEVTISLKPKLDKDLQYLEQVRFIIQKESGGGDISNGPWLSTVTKDSLQGVTEIPFSKSSIGKLIGTLEFSFFGKRYWARQEFLSYRVASKIIQ